MNRSPHRPSDIDRTSPEPTAHLARAVVYLRVSTARQANRGGEAEGYSIPAQREACTRKASDLGAEVVDEFVDAGASARSANRPALQALLERLRSARDVDYVIVHKVDRLARDRADDVAIGLAIHKAGAVLVSASEAVDDSPAGTLLHGIMASIAEFYSKNLAFEVKKGQRAKAMRGGTPGYAPLGYLNVTIRVDGQEVRSVEFDPERAEHVRWAFDAYASGEWSITDIVDELVRRGMCTRPTATRPSKPLSRSQVHRILGSSYYLGKLTYGGIEYDGQHDALIESSVWHRVQAVLAGRRLAGDRSWKNDHYLLGSLFCDVCGSRIGFCVSTGKTGEKYPYFFCLGRAKKRTDCTLPYLNVELVERKVARQWRDVALSRELIASIRATVTDELRLASTSAESTIRTQTARLQKLERQKQKLIDAYLAEALPVADLKQRQHTVAVEIHEAERLVAQCSGEFALAGERLETALGLLQHCERLYLRFDTEQRRALNQAFFTGLFLKPNGDVGSELNAPFAELVRATSQDVEPMKDTPRPDERPSGSPLAGATGWDDVRYHRTKKPVSHMRRRVSNLSYLAEGVGFEPTVSFPTHAFQACRFGRSRNPPSCCEPDRPTSDSCGMPTGGSRVAAS